MKLKILIVEDDKLLAEAVSDYFKGKGWETRQRARGMRQSARRRLPVSR